jgi:DNA invertase Pin-like site-specific DNA recombinase
MKTITKPITSDKINPMNTKAVIYARVSSKEQEETGYSLPAQEKLLSEYAQRKGFEVVKVFSISESASGAKQRQVFYEMMEFIKNKEIPHLLCEKVDRITRNMKDAVFINDWIEDDPDRQIHFVKQNLVIHKNAKSDEKFRWDIEIVLAKKFISNLSEEVKKGQAEKIRQGWLPTRPPAGYKTIGEKGHKIHVIDEKVAPLIKKAFELYSTGNYSMKRVCDELYKDGFRSMYGKKPAKSRIEDILKEPFYYGAMRWNDALYNNGAHQPIITKELFDKVQEVRTGGDTPKYKRHQFAFRKLLKCKECSGTITAEIQKGIIYYHCTHYKNCTQKKYTPEEQIEQKLLGVFKFFENITPNEAERIKEKIKKDHSAEIEYKENTIRTLNERYTFLQRRLDGLYDDRLDKLITPETWQRKQKEITDEQAGLLERVNKLKSEEAKYFEIWLNILDLARRAAEIYKKRSPEQRRTLLKYIFQSLLLKDGITESVLKPTVEKIAKRVQQKIDAQKNFELQQKTAKSVASSGSLSSGTSSKGKNLVRSKNNFRTDKNPSLSTQNSQTVSDYIPLLNIAREIGTFWKTNKAHIWIPNIKQGFFGITRPTTEEMRKYK